MRCDAAICSGKSQTFPGVMQRIGQLVHFFGGIVNAEAGTHGGGEAELVMQRHRAVMAMPHTDPFLIEQKGEILRVRPFQREGDDGPFVIESGAVDFQSWNFAELFRRFDE